jgi:hypothetical protein
MAAEYEVPKQPFGANTCPAALCLREVITMRKHALGSLTCTCIALMVSGGCGNTPGTSLSPSDVRVDSSAGSLANVTGFVHETAPTAATLVAAARVEIATGPDKGISTETDAGGRFTIAVRSRDAVLHVVRAGYDPADVRIGTKDSVDVALAPTEQTLAFEGNGALCSFNLPSSYQTVCVPAGAERVSDTYGFDIHRDGVFSVQTWWGVDYNDILYVDLKCGDLTTMHVESRFQSTGGVHRVNIVGGCRYQLVFRYSSGTTSVARYRFRVEHPS